MAAMLVRGLIFLMAVGATVPAIAQIPDEFKNLQFFPEDIPRGELIGAMRLPRMATSGPILSLVVWWATRAMLA